jgi:hypothetical protein
MLDLGRRFHLIRGYGFNIIAVVVVVAIVIVSDGHGAPDHQGDSRYQTQRYWQTHRDCLLFYKGDESFAFYTAIRAARNFSEADNSQKKAL